MKISFSWSKKDKANSFGIVLEECLNQHEADKLKTLDLEHLIEMDSGDRINIFKNLIGEQKAVFVNSRLETDIILKRQKDGMMSWLTGEIEIKPKWRKEIIREISKLDKPLNKKEMDAFISHLTDLRLGIGVTFDEASKIMELSKNVDKAKAQMENGGCRENYEKMRDLLDAYVDELKKS